MAIEPLKIPIRSYGENIPVAPDTNAEVEKINELVAAVNAGLATSNAIVGGPKYVQYLSSQTYGVPVDSSTLDRLASSTILPGVDATVINPHPTPLTATAASSYYRATIVPVGTAGAVLVPAFVGSADRVPIVWVEVVSNDTFTPLLVDELNLGKAAYAGLQLRPLLIALVNGVGTGSSTIVTTPAPGQVVQGPTVTGFLPGSAAEGASVTLTGIGFTKATAVLFNGTPASFQLINATTLVAVVPVGATTGPVAVTNSAGTGTSAANFEVKAAVVVTPAPAGDTTKPDLFFTVPATGATLAPDTDILLAVVANDNVGVVSLLFTNGTTGQAIGVGTKNGNTYTVSYRTPAAIGPLALVALATDAAGNSQPATVNVTVQAQANLLPVADAGSDATIQLPTSSLALMGTGYDQDGTIDGYAWAQVTGPNNATGLPSNTQNVVLSNLIAGIYQFRLTVTDNSGGKKTDDVLVTVNAIVTLESITLLDVQGDDSLTLTSVIAQ
jgi:hypothetical protein